MAIAAKQHIDDPDGRIIGYHWPSISTATSLLCDPVRISGFDDVTVTLHGAPFGATVALHVSSESSSSGFYAAKDANTAAAVSLTAADTGSLVSEGAVWYKPVLGGTEDTGGTTVLDVTLVAK